MTQRQPVNARTSALTGRRILALLVDWFLSQLIALGFLGMTIPAHGAKNFLPLAVFAVENILLVSTLGSTIGHWLFGLVVRREDGGPVVGLTRAVIRTVLLSLVVPAVVWGEDGRGLHDRFAGTRIVRR